MSQIGQSPGMNKPGGHKPIITGVRTMAKNFLYLLLFIIGLPLASQSIIEVSVEGISDGVKNSKQHDRDEAEMDAKLKAIEKLGVNIKSITEVENFILKKDWIESKAEAYLMPGFQIIDVGYGADGLYHVVLTGKVRTSISATEYKTVTIGTQVWMAENLNLDKFGNGDPIPEIQSTKGWLSACENSRPAWCYYDNNPENGKIYGKLYNWYAVNDTRGLAPKGWHVPSDTEWDELVTFLNGYNDTTYIPEFIVGYLLKHSSGWREGGVGNNRFGFTALATGARQGFGYRPEASGSFNSIGQMTYFWSSTKNNSEWPGSAYGLVSDKSFYDNDFDTAFGFSVRLVRD